MRLGLEVGKLWLFFAVYNTWPKTSHLGWWDPLEEPVILLKGVQGCATEG